MDAEGLKGLAEKRNRSGTRYFEDGEGEIVAKECRKCFSVKELDEFRRNAGHLGGRESECRVCRSSRGAKYYAENKKYCVERVSKWQRSNPEKACALSAKWYESNKEKAAESSAKWRAENKERKATKDAEWKRNNPEKTRMQDQRRRARKKALPDTLTAAQYAETMLFFGSACALTGETDNLHQEHAIPLAIGHGGTIRENMYPMAGRLNFSKGDRNIFEWFEANRQRFELSQERFDRLIDFLASANAMTVEEYREYVYRCHANPNE